MKTNIIHTSNLTPDQGFCLVVGPFKTREEAESRAKEFQTSSVGTWLDRWIMHIPEYYRDEIRVRLRMEEQVEGLHVYHSDEVSPDGDWALSFGDGYWLDTAETKEEADELMNKILEAVK